LVDFDVLVITPPYETEKYIKAIEEAEAQGYDVIILDSISHAWAGEGGLLDQQGKIADSGRGNSYTAWRNVTPKHNKFIEKMLSCNLHLIATMRSKTEYALATNDQGKQQPKKMGLAPVQREGMDYEFTVVFDIDTNHNATPSKDRTSLFDGKIFLPSEKTGKALLDWLESGVEAKVEVLAAAPKSAPPPDAPDFAPEEKATTDKVVSRKQLDRMFAIAGECGVSANIIKNYMTSVHGIESSKLLSPTQYDDVIKYIESLKKAA
jgi:hypothetical protein